jgi:hypothetical protein
MRPQHLHEEIKAEFNDMVHANYRTNAAALVNLALASGASSSSDGASSSSDGDATRPCLWARAA